MADEPDLTALMTAAAELLESFVADRASMLGATKESRDRLLRAAARSSPIRVAKTSRKELPLRAA